MSCLALKKYEGKWKEPFPNGNGSFQLQYEITIPNHQVTMTTMLIMVMLITLIVDAIIFVVIYATDVQSVLFFRKVQVLKQFFSLSYPIVSFDSSWKKLNSLRKGLNKRRVKLAHLFEGIDT